MRIVQLEGPDGGAPLVFHPSLTVVDGLAEDVRTRLVDVFRALPAGRDPGWAGLVEAHGVVLDLDAESLRLLGLGREVDVVVTAADLPDGRAGGRDAEAIAAAAPADDERLAGLRLSHEILAHGVAALKRSRIEFEEARLQAVEALEEARGELDPFATTAFEQAAAALARAETEAPEDPDGGADDPQAAGRARLRADRDELAARLAELDALDLGPVMAAMEQVEAQSGREVDLDAEAVAALAQALAAAEADVARIDEERRAEGRDPADLLRRIEGARLQVERLTSSSAPPAATAEDLVELEAAHDAVLAADARMSGSRLGGKAARKALDEAVAAEAEILDRIGFPTYSAFALAQSAPGPDPETRVELETARRELSELEAAYDLLAATEAQDLARTAALARRDELRADASALVDAEPHDLVTAVGALARSLEEEAAATVDPVDEPVAVLRARLQDCGVDFGDLDLSDDEVVDVGRMWLADTAELLEERPALAAELAALDARLAEDGLGEGEAEGATGGLRAARREVEVAEARLARHRQASDRVAELCGLLEEIEVRLRDLGENISAQEALVAAAAEGLAAAEDGDGADPGVSAEDLLSGQPAGVDDTEWYLLTRLATLRALSFAGSVPLVLDGALCGLSRERTHAVLEQVATMSDVVQVVYLGGDEAVVEWAALHDAAAVVSVAAVPA